MLESTTRNPSSETVLYIQLFFSSNSKTVIIGSVSILYEQALKSEKGTALTASGALVTDSGAKKGRSPKDKRIVDEPTTSNDIWVCSLSPFI